MTKRANSIAWAFTGSALINAFLFSSVWFARPNGPQSLYVKIANALAAPPGYIAGKLVRPEHSLGSYVAFMLLALVISILFYGAVCWIVIRAAAAIRSMRQRQTGTGLSA